MKQLSLDEGSPLLILSSSSIFFLISVAVWFEFLAIFADFFAILKKIHPAKLSYLPAKIFLCIKIAMGMSLVQDNDAVRKLQIINQDAIDCS